VLKDPRSVGPRPPFARPTPRGAGEPENLDPKPDHGEHSYRGSGRLAGCAAIVTEADAGVGRAIAIAFAREGADVVIAFLADQEGANETARWVTQSGRRAILLEGAVRDERYRTELVDRAVSELGRLDVLVNNTAFQWAHHAVKDAPASEIEREVRTNTESVLFLSKCAATRMGAGGSIIHTTTIQAAHPSAQLRAYATTQLAVANFTTSLAQQLAKEGIRVNAVAPGPVWTSRIVATLPDADFMHFGSETLLGRPAQPAELAPAYVFLASDDASYITGTVLSVSGGGGN
jgi:NAD(P)-dependent dehydrogenase (short-subunit alcohol dehydrogenase family)